MTMSGDKRMPADVCFITEFPAHLETCGVPVRMQSPSCDLRNPAGLRLPRQAPSP